MVVGAALSCSDAGYEDDLVEVPALPLLSAASSGPTLQLQDGVVQGTVSGSTRTFIGIPYAAPPTAERRWTAPADVEPWSGVLDAVGPGVTCVQSTAASSPGAPQQSEDCLKLNVFAPDPAQQKAVPVLVWFHGGSNRAGSANDSLGFGLPSLYDGARLRATASRDVIVVTVNYRLGVFGFLAHPALSVEQGASGNYGLMDQQAALRWVQANIAAFGGDPNNVTVFGESAGAIDVGYQLVAKGSEALFQRAIMQSGLFDMKLPTLAEWEAEGVTLAEHKGCSGIDAAAISCLRSFDASALLPDALPSEPGGAVFVSANPDAKRYWGANNTSSLGIVDGQLIVEQPIVSYREGRYVQGPMIIGSNAREGSAFVNGETGFTDEAQLSAALERTFGAQASRIAAQYPVSSYPSVNDAAVEIAGDSSFVCSAYTLARLASRRNDVFVYHWTRAAQILGLADLGATHAVELSWVWNWWTALLGGPSYEVALAERVADHWTTFAESGDPSVDSLSVWPSYDEQTDPELVLDLTAHPQQGQRAERCKLWLEVRAALWGDAWKL
jgi:para-nitrobenzyl esterase